MTDGVSGAEQGSTTECSDGVPLLQEKCKHTVQ